MLKTFESYHIKYFYLNILHLYFKNCLPLMYLLGIKFSRYSFTTFKVKTTQPSPLSLQPVNKPQNVTLIIILLYLYIHHLSRRTRVFYFSVTMEFSNLTHSLILIQGKSTCTIMIWNPFLFNCMHSIKMISSISFLWVRNEKILLLKIKFRVLM